MKKFNALSLVLSMFYLPIYMYYSWRLLEYIQAPEILWFLWWLTVPFAIISPILSKLAEWEKDD